MAEGPSVEAFDGDLEALYGLIARSWDHDYRGTMRLEYSRDLLHWSMSGPTGDPDLLLGAYHGGRLVGSAPASPAPSRSTGENVRTRSGPS